MFTSFFGSKINTSQAFSQQGDRLVVSNILVEPLRVTQIKTTAKDGYWAVQVAIGAKKNKLPLFRRELRLDQEPSLKPGDQIKVADVFKIGDRVRVSGLSKGRGFSGVVKRWGFRGGPKTHGQSDRSRAPGSIGQRTTPGRVWKGKKMAGHYGQETKTIRNLRVIALDEDKNIIQLSGTVPGSRHSLLELTKTGSFVKSEK
jgi:large subunit ribosomal protein L3